MSRGPLGATAAVRPGVAAGGHRAPGERDGAGSRRHRGSGRGGSVRRPPSWPRRGWYRSHERRSRRVGRTARATRGRECRCTRRSCDSRHGGDCGGDEYDRPNSPRPPDPSRQEHGPFSRSTRAGAGQTYAGDASKVMGTGGVRDPSAHPPCVWSDQAGHPAEMRRVEHGRYHALYLRRGVRFRATASLMSALNARSLIFSPS